MGVKDLSKTITRAGQDLTLLRGALAVARVVERAIEHGMGYER